MTDVEPHNTLLHTAEALEQSSSLDPLRTWYHWLAGRLPPGRALDELRGRSIGHPLHPALTALPLGLWASAAVLDLTGDDDGARRLLGAGFLAAVPTAVSGLADWDGLRSVESSRVGALHGVLNAVGTMTFGLSWVARRNGHRARGRLLALAGGAVIGASAYLGGHLTLRRGEPAASGVSV